jgi:hypothetical protein
MQQNQTEQCNIQSPPAGKGDTMKNFIEKFSDARSVGTPFVNARTADPASTIANVGKMLGEELENTPMISWDSIHGLKGLGEKDCKGSKALLSMAQLVGVENLAVSVDLPTALGILEFAGEDVIVFVHNPQLVWNEDKKVVQGIWNLRDIFCANGSMLVLMTGAGDILPVELQQDILVLDEPLPTREELAKIVEEVYIHAAENHKACDITPHPSVIKASCDALIGLPSFPAAQAVAMELDKDTGKMNIPELWARKKSIISQMPGLTFHQGGETLADMYGCDSFRKFAQRMVKNVSLILRVDEIQRQFAGCETDSSGSTGKLIGEFMTWVNDHQVICTLLLGVPGSSKSHSIYCIGGEEDKPIINYDPSAMEDKLVGEGGKHMRNANRAVESISDGKVWLIATANSLRGLPPELISRFQVGGIFFFDCPDARERKGIMELKVKKYGLQEQPFPDMELWTGRDIENCARKASLLGMTLIEAAEYVVPLMKSHSEEIDALRQSAHDRFLSASNSGVYQYSTPSPKVVTHTPIVNAGRKIR